MPRTLEHVWNRLLPLALLAAYVHRWGLDRVDKQEQGVAACERLVTGAVQRKHSRKIHPVARLVEDHTVAGDAGVFVGIAAVAAGRVMVEVA